jgi:nitrogen-specific signal transduction histidine kinase
MEIFEELLEHDLNPFILFDSDGKIKKFNKEAEFLMNFVTSKELFSLALEHASKNFGFNKEFTRLQFDKQSYYAILVGYISDNEIALRLFKEVGMIEPVKIDNNFTETNIFTLLEIARNTTLVDSKLKITDIYDVSIPEFKMNINDFLLIINSIFEAAQIYKTLTLKVFIKIGEYEIINNNKYKIVSLVFNTEGTIKIDKSLNYGKKNLINIIKSAHGIKVELPLIV